MCINCCIFKYEYESPLVFPWEVRKILGFNKDQLFKPYLLYRTSDLYITVLYKWIMNGKCIFLNSDNSCRIHFEKPLSCKMYPLLIGLSDNTLRVSSSCRFIIENQIIVQSIDPSIVFVNEYLNALKTYIFLKIIDEYALSNNWERLVASNNIDRDKCIDIDQFVETNSLMNSIEETLSKYSYKPA